LVLPKFDSISIFKAQHSSETDSYTYLLVGAISVHSFPLSLLVGSSFPPSNYGVVILQKMAYQMFIKVLICQTIVGTIASHIS